MVSTILRHERFNDASELIEALRPHGPRWDPCPGDWIYRGLPDSSFELVPSAFRARSWRSLALPGETPFDPGSCTSEDEQALQEYGVLRRYFEGLDEAGLDIPNEIFVRNFLDHVGTEQMTKGRHDHKEFITDPAIKTFAALAQHHGVPTRLLDWTRAGLHAAYFASREAATLAPKSGTCSVWALSTAFLVDTKLPVGGPRPPGLQHVQLLTAPRASNPNLHAQAGLFTAWFGAGGVKALDLLVQSLFDSLDPALKAKWERRSALWHFTLPWSEAPVLLRMLASERVDAQRLFPGRDGVVLAMKERSRWDR